MPKVSIVVANYNNARFLKDCLNSLIAQSYKDFEVLVFDDCSTDNSRELISNYSIQDQRIQLIPLSVNRGVAYLRSIALSYCQGQYVAILDADDYSSADRLLLQTSFLDANPEVVLVSGFASEVDVDGNTLMACLPIPTTDAELRWRMINGDCFVHSTIMFRKQAAIAAGGYNADMTCAEDMDLISRIMLHGKLGAIHSIVSHWRNHKVSYTQQANDKILEGTYKVLCDNVQRMLNTTISTDLAKALHTLQPVNPDQLKQLLSIVIKYHSYYTNYETESAAKKTYNRLCIVTLLDIRKRSRKQSWFSTAKQDIGNSIRELQSIPNYNWMLDCKLRISFRKRMILLMIHLHIIKG